MQLHVQPSRSGIAAFSIVIALVLGIVDYLTGPYFSLTVFYLFPVALAAWYIGRRAAILVSIFCALVWTIADIGSFGTNLSLALDLWNSIVRFSFFMIVSYTLTSTRRAIDRENALAKEIQHSLLPVSLPRIQGIEISTVYRPAAVLSGDYFDILPTGEGDLVVCIADVAGKGPGPALLMANLQATVRALVLAGRSPADLCGEINRFVVEHGVPSRIITFFICRIDRERTRLEYANAGHNPPILVRADGSQLLLSEGGLVLGVSVAARYVQAEVPVHPGDNLVLYTDGLTEAQNRRGEEFGLKRLIHVLAGNGGASAGRLKARLIEEAHRFHYGTFQDDMTLVILSLGG